MDVQRHFHQYFIYKVIISFIDGETKSTQRTPQIFRKSISHVSHILVS